MKWTAPLLMLAAVVLLFLLTDPLPQDVGYHDFADARALAGLPNAANVLSNLPFLVAGLWGVWLVSAREVSGHLRPAWGMFFASIFLTAVGSGWYHLSPDNASLVWDRLPMTMAFMSMLTVLVGEYLDAALARLLLVPLLLVGGASVAWWGYTEGLGAGDLRPYALVALLPMPLIIALLLWKGRGHYLTRPLWFLVAAYLLAKIFEFLDREIYALGNTISGHSLKHLAAALVPVTLLAVLHRRSRLSAAPDDFMH